MSDESKTPPTPPAPPPKAIPFPQPAPTTLIPDLFPGMTEEEALSALRGKNKDLGQRAVIQLIRLAREDVLDASTKIDLGVREAGFFAGAAHVLRELERMIVQAHAQPLE